MRAFTILTDSCCDLPAPLAKELNLTVIPMCIHMGETTYHNFLDGREIGFHEFYERLRTDTATPSTTSAISVGDYHDFMRPILESGRDVLCLTFSSALSTTYQSAVIAADDLREEFPEARVEVVDSLCASLGQGLFLTLCAREAQKGRSLDEVRAFAEETRHQVCHWFTVDDLSHLKRGGRISAATALVGTMLSIKPVLHVDEHGALVSMAKARGRKAALMALVDKMEALALDPAHGPVFLSHGDCEADARIVAEEITRRFGNQDITTNYIGPVIGNHSGPGTVALFFLGQER